MAKANQPHAALRSWQALNSFLMSEGEDGCLALLKEEKKGKARLRFLLRIHSRYNKLRAHRERVELQESSLSDG